MFVTVKHRCSLYVCRYDPYRQSVQQRILRDGENARGAAFSYRTGSECEQVRSHIGYTGKTGLSQDIRGEEQ